MHALILSKLDYREGLANTLNSQPTHLHKLMCITLYPDTQFNRSESIAP